MFGGRFDPPHLGHLLLAQQAVELLMLDELWFVPAKAPPHKATVASAEHRFMMVNLATLSNPCFKVSRIELDRQGPSYSVDTVLDIKTRLPDAQIFFLTGVDAYADIASWQRAEEIVNMAHMIALPRPGYTLEELTPFFKERVTVLQARQIEISSTDIRARMQAGKSVRYLVPELVENYFAKESLYDV